MGNRRRNPSKNKGPRTNESPATKPTTNNVPETAASAPEGSDVWDRVTPADLRDIINRYPNYGLRFPTKLVIRLLDEIERLEGQA